MEVLTVEGGDPRVFIIAGRSGVGKSTLLTLLRLHPELYTVHVRGTNRTLRGEDKDVEAWNPNEEPRKYDYVYEVQFGPQPYCYGVKRDRISDSLAVGLNHVVICNDLPTIAHIKQDFGSASRVYLLTSDHTSSDWLAFQMKRGIPERELAPRWEEGRRLEEAFKKGEGLFDGELKNEFMQMVNQLRRFNPPPPN